MIKALSIFWMFAIILCHADTCAWEGGVIWYKELMSDCRMAGVGYFYAVSGYFLLKHYKQHDGLAWWRQAMKKRVKSLLVPYFAWCVISLLICGLLHGFGQYMSIRMLCAAFGVTGVLPVVNNSLWYIKFLYVFVTLSPLGVWILSKRRSATVILCFILLMVPILPVPMKFSLFYSGSLFLFGMYCAMFGSNFGKSWRWIFFVLWVVLYIVRIHYPNCVMLQMYGAYAAIVVSWVVAELFLRDGIIDVPFVPTFFIYCSNALVVKCLPPAASPAMSLIRGLALFLLCIGIAYLLRKVLPRTYSVLTGNR